MLASDLQPARHHGDFDRVVQMDEIASAGFLLHGSDDQLSLGDARLFKLDDGRDRL